MKKQILLLLALVFCAAFLSAFNYFEVYRPPLGAVFPKREQVQIAQRGLYLTVNSVLRPAFLKEVVQQAKRCGLNSVVVDVKALLRDKLQPALRGRKLFDYQVTATSPALKNIIDYLHGEGLLVSGRIVVFKDEFLVLQRPDLALRHAGGGVWFDRSGSGWADPYSEEVWQYNVLLAELAAVAGVDEVQFDYIRFPTEGNLADLVCSHRKKNMSRAQAIAAFVKKTKARLEKYNVALSADIFGVVAWQTRRDIETLGQDLNLLKHDLDAVCPMLYPSHFHPGYDGYAFPGDEPYYFMRQGVAKLKKFLYASGEAEMAAGGVAGVGHRCAIGPWIQGFGWGTHIFGPGYIRVQIQALKDEGINNYLVWNASNAYAVTFQALGGKK